MKNLKHKSKIAIAIFAKTPGLSPIKTRLAKDIGAKLALEVYKLSVKAVLELVQETKNRSVDQDSADLYLCLAEAGAEDDPFWQDYKSVFNFLWTGDGDLGERLANIHDLLIRDHEVVVILGSDSPQICVNDLTSHIYTPMGKDIDHQIGPAKDGGFYLIKSFKTIPRKIWTAVHYSTKDTLSEITYLLQLQENGGKVELLKEEEDIDDLLSLKAVRDGLLNAKLLLPIQGELLEFIQNKLVI